VTDEPRRDGAIARAIEGVAVPEYQPGFWDRLDARLSAEGFPGLDVPSLDVEAEAEPSVPALTAVTVAAQPQPAPDPDVTPLKVARRSARRRSLAALAVAAAAVIAVVALQVTDPAPDTLETASGGPEATLRAPGGGSTTAEDDAGGSAEEDPTALVEGSTPEGDAPAAEGQAGAAAGSAPSSGATAPASDDRGGPAASVALGPAGTTGTPQDAFATWAAAIDAGDTDAVVALTGPRTARYYEASGTSVAEASKGWREAYGAWAEDEGRRIDALEAGRTSGARVVVLLLERPAADAADGVVHDAVPVVEGEEGWVVEPAAFDSKEGGRIEVTSPAPASKGRTTTVRRSATVEIAADDEGTYTLALDRTTTTAIPASDAVDGTIRWDPPDKAMTVGRHVLVVVHVTDDAVTALSTVLDVVA
jgi:hypothetical protein